MSAGRKSITENKDWCTPQKYVNAVKRVWGGKIALDPCSSVCSIVNAETEFLLPQKNGLLEDWNFATIYVNPPYGADKSNGTTIKNWFRKIADTYTKYNNEIIVLAPVATNTLHWKKYVYPFAKSICFLYDTRLKFIIGGTDDNKGAPMACCAIYYGNNPNNFSEIFSEFGATISLVEVKIPKIQSEFGDLQLAMENF